MAKMTGMKKISVISTKRRNPDAGMCKRGEMTGGEFITVYRVYCHPERRDDCMDAGGRVTPGAVAEGSFLRFLAVLGMTGVILISVIVS